MKLLVEENFVSVNGIKELGNVFSLTYFGSLNFSSSF